MKTKAIRRIETLFCFCRNCWQKLSYDFEWQLLEGKTMAELQTMCNEKHKQHCVVHNADVRLHGTTKSR